MKSSSIIIILTIILNACSMKGDKQSINERIFGKWETENCLPGRVHAFISIQQPDSAKILQHRITTDFSIEFKSDTSFVFENDKGPTKTGIYKLSESSLTLTLKNEHFLWLNFHIDSITNNRLSLSSGPILFFTKKADSITLFTSDTVKIRMKRK